jgi:hypothetical protein
MNILGMIEFAFCFVLLPAFCALLLVWIASLLVVAASLWLVDVVFKRCAITRVQCCPPVSPAVAASL